MKTIITLLLFILFLTSCSKKQNSEVKITSYDVKVKYDTLSRYLNVNADIEINFTGNGNKIGLLFNNIAKINNIHFITDKNKYLVIYHFDSDTIFLNIPDKLENYKHFLLNFDYKLPIDSFQMDNVFSVFRTYKWIPLQYDALSKWKIEIEVPANYEAFSSGELMDTSSNENHSYYTWEYIYNSGVPLIIAPKNIYNITQKLVGNKELDFYFIIKDTSTINPIIKEICKSFNYYNILLGEYKNNKLRLFEYPDSSDNGFFAVSLETFTIVGNKMLKYNNDPSINSWITHEPAHQWISNGYVNSFFSKLYKLIEEGLTEYVRFMYIEDTYGKDSLNKLIENCKYIFHYDYKNTQNDVPLSSPNADYVIYFKGPLIFHYVRNQIGKENFINFIRTLYNKYYGKVIDYDIFKMELSKYDKTGKVIKRMEELSEMTGDLPPDL